jgi:hypothetical protein
VNTNPQKHVPRDAKGRWTTLDENAEANRALRALCGHPDPEPEPEQPEQPRARTDAARNTGDSHSPSAERPPRDINQLLRDIVLGGC